MKTVIRHVLVFFGSICVALGVLGIFLPLVPTTPLLLLGAACYVRGSEKMYNRLLANKWLGPYIRDFREGRGMPLKAKVTTLVVLWITMIFSALAIEVWWLRALLFLIAVGVTVYLSTLKNR